MKSFYTSLLILIIFFQNCSSTKSTYENTSGVGKDDKSSIFLLEKLKIKNDQSIIYFRETFDNTVQIKVDQENVFNERLVTVPQLGFAGACIISNDKEVSITIDYKKKIVLNKEKLPNYKFIYVGKYKTNYTIEYTNTAQPFQ